jgi:hypothetical protein
MAWSGNLRQQDATTPSMATACSFTRAGLAPEQLDDPGVRSDLALQVFTAGACDLQEFFLRGSEARPQTLRCLGPVNEQFTG